MAISRSLDGRVRLDAVVEGTRVTLLPLARANQDVNKMIDFGPYLTKQRTVDIDASGLGGVQSVSFPVYLLEVFGDAGFALTVKLPDGEMRFSAMAAKSVARQILREEVDTARVLNVPDVDSYIREHGIDTEIVVRVARVNANALSAMQQSALGGGVALDTSLSYVDGKIQSYDGAIEITAPYAGRLPVRVWHLGDLQKEPENNEIILPQNVTELKCVYEDGRVRFDALRFSLFAIDFAGAAANAAAVSASPFVDMSPQDWFYTDMLWAYANRFVEGDGMGNVWPNEPMTRAALVTILWRMAGSRGAIGAANSFVDVQPGDWFARAAAWAAESGVVSNRGGSFGPSALVTRQEMAAMILNYAVYDGKATSGSDPPALAVDFADADSISDYAAPGVAWCYESGVITGRPGKLFDPRTNVNRAETVTMMHRYSLL
jgi:hypothetical protein